MATRPKSLFVRDTEVWIPSEDRTELTLAQGDYGELVAFATESVSTRFGFGEGLPGRAWERGHPIVMRSLTRPLFVREEAASAAGLTRGLAIPLLEGTDEAWILTFLSAISTPIANRFEVWTPRSDGSGLVFQFGICESGEDLADTYAGAVVGDDASILGQMCGDGVPHLSSKIDGEAGPVASSCARAELDAPSRRTALQ